MHISNTEQLLKCVLSRKVDQFSFHDLEISEKILGGKCRTCQKVLTSNLLSEDSHRQ